MAVAQAPSRTPAEVMSFRGADWLERSARDAEQRPDEVVAAMGLRNGDVVADIGCGTGYFTRRLARAVGPTGSVYAVDIQPEMLERLRAGLVKEGLSNVVAILGENDDPKLPAGTIAWALLVDVYHEFQNPKAMLAGLRRGLAPSGKVALVEYRAEGDSAAHISPRHRMSVDQILREWLPAGFTLERREEFLPTQHLLVFARRND